MQFPSYTTETLHLLDESLAHFHQNKSVFVDLGMREHFNIPKFHSLIHYRSSISLFGTTNNYNTEQTEHLHIDFAKNMYRATNHKDEYPQMTTWLKRHEKIEQHAIEIEGKQDASHHHGASRESATKPIGPPCMNTHNVKMAKRLTVRSMRFNDIVKEYGTVTILDTLANFIIQINNPGASTSVLYA